MYGLGNSFGNNIGHPASTARPACITQVELRGYPANVKSVTVSGPGITGTVNVPVVCDNAGILSSVNCGSGWGKGTQRVFDYYLSGYWPPIGSKYTFTLTDLQSTEFYFVSLSSDSCVLSFEYSMAKSTQRSTRILNRL